MHMSSVANLDEETASDAIPPSEFHTANVLDLTPDCIKTLSVDGTLLSVNKAGCIALGIAPNSEFGMPWLSLLPEDVRPAGTAALANAVSGRPAGFPGRSISPGGVIYWDNLLMPIFDPAGVITSILCVSRDITEKIVLEQELHEAAEREKLLAREMHHRIKNLFSVVQGLISIAEKEAAEDGAPDTATSIFRDKLGALSRASDAAFADAGTQAGDAELTDLTQVIRSVLQPYGDRCLSSGSAVCIRRDAVPTFALILHEMATNALKYGALSTNDGNVTVRWTADDQILTLAWIEAGGPPISVVPERQGFGTQMVDRIARSRGGAINRHWLPEGLTAELLLPYPQKA